MQLIGVLKSCEMFVKIFSLYCICLFNFSISSCPFNSSYDGNTKIDAGSHNQMHSINVTLNF